MVSLSGHLTTHKSNHDISEPELGASGLDDTSLSIISDLTRMVRLATPSIIRTMFASASQTHRRARVGRAGGRAARAAWRVGGRPTGTGRRPFSRA